MDKKINLSDGTGLIEGEVAFIVAKSIDKDT